MTAAARLADAAERRWVRLPLGLVAGLLVCAALPPWGWWPLALLGVALWVLLLDGRSGGQRWWVGVVVGLGWFLPSTLWMVKFSAPGWIVGVSVWFPGVTGLASLLCPPRRAALVLPGAAVLAEWVRWHAPFGGVPLSSLAVTQAAGPLLPVARLAGTLGVVAAVATTGAALAALVAGRAGGDPRRVRRALGALVAVVAVTLVGVVAPRGRVVGHLDVAAVQGGGPQQTLSANTDYAAVLDRHLRAARAGGEGADLVVLPENIVNVGGTFAGSTEEAAVAELARDLGATVVVGIVEGRGDAETFRNAAIAIDARGRSVDRYDKVRRVPFGEYTPMRGLMTWLAEATGSFVPPRDAVPGRGPAVLDTDAGRLGVVVSWEVFFGRRVREAVRNDAAVVLNPTNGASYWLTQVQSQQVAQSTLRAVESGRWLVQSAPTGFSAIVDPSGDVVARTGTGEARVLRGRVELRSGRTLAALTGDALPLAFAGVLVALGLADRRRGAGSNDPAPGEESPLAP